MVALAWRRPRFDPEKPGLPLPSWVTTTVDSAVTRWVVGLLSLALTGWVAYTAVTRPAGANPLPGVFYVLLWVGLVAASVLLGPVWRLISPSARCTGSCRGPDRRRYPERLGYWPAAAGLFAFVWLELAGPDPGSVAAIRTWLLIYLAVTLAGALCCGQRWLESADPFEVYSTVAVAGVAVAPTRRSDRARQPVRSPALDARATGARRRAGSPVGIRRRSTASRPCPSGATSSTRTPDPRWPPA